MRKLKRWAS